MITEDLDIFLNDFGVSVTAGAVSGIGILNTPGESILDDRVISTGYTLVCRSDEFGGLGYGAILEADGTGYIVQENMLIADGKFCRLHLEKVADDQPITVVLDGDIF